MSNELIETIVSENDKLRNRSIHDLLRFKDKDHLLRIAKELENFRISSDNLYHKVRASLFLFVIYHFYLENNPEIPQEGEIPVKGVKAAYDRDFENALDIFLNGGQNGAVFSAVADSYYRIAFKYLLDQVKLSMSSCRENFNLYNIKGLEDYPYRVPVQYLERDGLSGRYPIGVDATPVRLDPSHSGWSDIFFLGMDFPEGARVVNLSVNLKIHGSEAPLLPPCECYCGYIEEPVIELTSVDLKSSKKIDTVEELFNFGNDYLSLLKAGVVASGLVPPCFENSDINLEDLLRRLLGRSGGIRLITNVNGIPKGSRLAVSTTLLSTVITSLMRFSGQIKNIEGQLSEEERRIVASRAILGEWLGGSGGGWQDSGGLWPGLKLIRGMVAKKGNPEFGVSRGCLLPDHYLFSREEIGEEVEKRIVDSMVLVHGGISQDVGPILEMVTQKYLLKYNKEWNARLAGIAYFDRIVDALKIGDMKELGRLTTEDWEGPIQDVIPWVNNAFTEDMIGRVKEEFGEDYWGFLMLGGMSGGGMAFIVNPEIREIFKEGIARIMSELKKLYCSSLPFIIDPVVYDFEFNHDGIVSTLLTGDRAIMPGIEPEITTDVDTHISTENTDEGDLKERYGFDLSSHEYMKSLLKEGKIGLAKNRLPLSTIIENVRPEDIERCPDENADYIKTGLNSLMRNEIAIVAFAGGMGSRWSQGAAVVKSINPFICIDSRYRSFIEIHLAKSGRTKELYGHYPPIVFTTSYLTDRPIRRYLDNFNYFGHREHVFLSPSKSIGHRVYPMERDLRFYWEKQLHQKMDDNVQKVQDSAHEALIEWARSKGEGEDYSDNRPILRFNPPGHWYEIPNMFKNGVLARLLRSYPDLKYLLCHNIDTLGVSLEPSLLGMHIESGSTLTFEVTPRRIEDAGGGLAKINGKPQLVEGMALPREEDEYKLSYYNTLTNWIDIELLLEFFGINRDMIIDAETKEDKKRSVIEAVHRVEKMIPTYVTIKNVKYLWGSGQEDTYPVVQFEKLWGDMTGLDNIDVRYVPVPRYRGMQLKEPSLLDKWATDGSFEYVKSKCLF